jgi:magnesium transporter
MQETVAYNNFANEIESILLLQDATALHLFLDEQNISEIAEWIEEHEEYASTTISNMAIHRAAAVFKIVELKIQKTIINQLPATKTAELINELPADDRTDLFEGLPSNVVRELIKTLSFGERKIALSLLGYPENSVGRLMTPDYVYIYENDTVADVLDTIRRVGKNSETIDVIYVINEKGELLDDIQIREIILSQPTKRVNELMDGRVITLKVEDDQEVAHDVFKMNNRVALPVVSKTNKLLGIVTIDDILWVQEEEYSEDMQKIGGTEALDEPYLETPFWKLISKRATWLVILFIGELFTASAMSFFEDTIKKVIVLNMLVPLIISSGGNSGSQAATLVIQAMAKGEVLLSDAWRIFRREIKSGLVLGTILGLVGIMRTFLWSYIEPSLYGTHTVALAAVTFFSVLGVVLWGTLIGSMLPIFLKRMKLDPATSSAPFVATLVDVFGIVIYFSIALLFLSGKMI